MASSALLDFHQDMYNEEFRGGLANWAVDDDNDVLFPLLGFSANYFLLPALMAAYDNLWTNASVNGKGLQDWYTGAWRHVAAYFKANPYVPGYNLYNGPDPGSGIYSCLLPADGTVHRRQAHKLLQGGHSHAPGEHDGTLVRHALLFSMISSSLLHK